MQISKFNALLFFVCLVLNTVKLEYVEQNWWTSIQDVASYSSPPSHKNQVKLLIDRKLGSSELDNVLS